MINTLNGMKQTYYFTVKRKRKQKVVYINYLKTKFSKILIKSIVNYEIIILKKNKEQNNFLDKKFSLF